MEKHFEVDTATGVVSMPHVAIEQLVAERVGNDMGVTGNAQLLLGCATGGLEKHGEYRVIDVEIHIGALTLENTATGNTYRLTAVQLTGTE